MVGLPGSGKTHWGSRADGLFLDDISQTGPHRLKESFDQKTLIVADPSLCRPGIRFLAEKMIRENHPGSEIEWVFWANDPEGCWANVQARRDGRVISKRSLYALSEIYEIPSGVETKSVWRPECCK